jgi:hypothetical protein
MDWKEFDRAERAYLDPPDPDQCSECKELIEDCICCGDCFNREDFCLCEGEEDE